MTCEPNGSAILKRPIANLKIFIDTSALIAGITSKTGASAAVLDLCEAEIVRMVISRQVLTEADRNFSAKLPNLTTQFRNFIRNLAPMLVDDPPPEAIEKAMAIVDRKDASILAAALAAKADFLVTLDKKHFLSAQIRRKIPIKVVTPAEFLSFFERICLEE